MAPEPDPTEPDNDRTLADRAHQRYDQVSPWLQFACVVAIVIMAIINATIATQPIDRTAFLLVTAIGVGLDPQRLLTWIRGG